MKKIIYNTLGYMGVYHPKTDTVENVECLIGVEKPYSKANEEIAKAEAYNGEYTIEDDGVEEQPAPEQRIAELEEALALLLSGVTE